MENKNLNKLRNLLLDCARLALKINLIPAEKFKDKAYDLADKIVKEIENMATKEDTLKQLNKNAENLISILSDTNSTRRWNRLKRYTIKKEQYHEHWTPISKEKD